MIGFAKTIFASG